MFLDKRNTNGNDKIIVAIIAIKASFKVDPNIR